MVCRDGDHLFYVGRYRVIPPLKQAGFVIGTLAYKLMCKIQILPLDLTV